MGRPAGSAVLFHSPEEIPNRNIVSLDPMYKRRVHFGTDRSNGCYFSA